MATSVEYHLKVGDPVWVVPDETRLNRSLSFELSIERWVVISQTGLSWIVAPSMLSTHLQVKIAKNSRAKRKSLRDVFYTDREVLDAIYVTKNARRISNIIRGGEFGKRTTLSADQLRKVAEIIGYKE